MTDYSGSPAVTIDLPIGVVDPAATFLFAMMWPGNAVTMPTTNAGTPVPTTGQIWPRGNQIQR